MSFFEEKDLNRRDALWLETLSEFGIFPITLKKRSVHVLGDVLSRALHVTNEVGVQNMSALIFNLSSLNAFRESQRKDKYFGAIMIQIEEV